jgi:hypothetical protein
VVWVALLALVFGAADQFLGTTHVIVHTGAWTTTVSNMSALWLIVPFLAGWSQRTPRRAVLAAALSLLAAFSGYWLMTLSPFEGVSTAQAVHGVVPLIAGHAPWLVGGAVGGPLFGMLGFRWRTQRAWTSAVVVSSILCLEPVAHVAAGAGAQFSDAHRVWVGEMIAGGCTAAAMLAIRLRGTTE